MARVFYPGTSQHTKLIKGLDRGVFFKYPMPMNSISKNFIRRPIEKKHVFTHHSVASTGSFIQRNMVIFIFFIIHLFPFISIYTGLEMHHVIFLMGFYIIGMLSIILGYHRYFSHRAFKTNRFFQFILAFMAQCTAQKGVLWWASHHRMHHKLSDSPKDPHSPRQKGFWCSHMGWFISRKHEQTNFKLIKDFAKYPELVWLNQYHLLPPVFLGALALIFLGPSGLWFSFFLGVVLLWHCTYTINSLSHVWGRVRYETGDDSKNNWLLAVLTLGEGWHNNHHHYMHSARQGFFWYEIDIGYYVLKLLSFFRIVSRIRNVPLKIKIADKRC